MPIKKKHAPSIDNRYLIALSLFAMLCGIAGAFMFMLEHKQFFSANPGIALLTTLVPTSIPLFVRVVVQMFGVKITQGE